MRAPIITNHQAEQQEYLQQHRHKTLNSPIFKRLLMKRSHLIHMHQHKFDLALAKVSSGVCLPHIFVVMGVLKALDVNNFCWQHKAPIEDNVQRKGNR